MTLKEKADVMDHDQSSYSVPISLKERLGFGAGYQLRRHNNLYEAAANQVTHFARQDWHRYIGPIETFGNTNPYHGHFVSISLPFTLPSRIAIISYILECELLNAECSQLELLTFANNRRFLIRRDMRVGEQGYGGKPTILTHFASVCLLT